jgi:AcrR family transcriptional regulator
MGERRDDLADAAIGVLAREGLRGLTHRAVDGAAGLAEGTSSYYFRTRAALLQACVDRLTTITVGRVAPTPATDATPTTSSALATDQAEARSGSAPGTDGAGPATGMVDRACALLERWLGPDRDLLIARYELSLESTRRPELEAALVAGGARVRAAVAAGMRAAGLDHPEQRANDLVACIDGLAFDEVAGAGRHARDADARRRAVASVVTAFTAPAA